MQCTFCGHNMRYWHYTRFADKAFLCCHWCESLLSYYGLCTALSQCMDCGIIIGQSPFKGRIFLDWQGRPNLTVGYSHGICETCARIRLEDWRQLKALRQANLLVETALQAV